MYWNRFTDKLSAFLTRSIITINYRFTRFNPSLTAIGSRSSNPKWRFVPRHAFGHIFRMTVLTTEAKSRLAFILIYYPFFYFKYLSAIMTSKFNPFSPSWIIRSAHLFTGKGIGWSFPLPKLITYLMVVGHTAILHMPLTTTFIRTKACLVLPVWANLKFFSTNFASQCNHTCIIPHDNNTGTIEIAKKRIQQAMLQMRLGI